MQFSNSQKLAAVLSLWARPAISELATSKLIQLPFVRSVQAMLINSGIVGQSYSIGNEIKPFASNVIDAMFLPIITYYLSKIPDDTLPTLAHTIVDTALQQPRFGILDDLVEFSREDMAELKQLLDKNLPTLPAGEKYEVIK